MAYSRIAETFGTTGHIELVAWNRAFLLGQVVEGPSGPGIGGFIRTYEYSWLVGHRSLRLSRRC